MSNKCFHLSTCSTCKRIISGIKLPADTQFIDIKQENISAEDLDFVAAKLGSYEAAFNKRAQKLKTIQLEKDSIKDADYRSLILNEYTFLKRPVFILKDEVFAGNSPSEIERLKSFIG
jgi:arsenate reductase-like glutaredoxin family protein